MNMRIATACATLKGTETRDHPLSQRVVGSGLWLLEVPSVFFALVYLLLRWLFQLVARSSDDLTRDVEVVVLRHQLKVLRRQVGRPHLRRRDRLFMVALSRALPRARWSSSFLVTPQTLLRWHRELVRRKWTFDRKSVGGRPLIPDEVRALIVRMGRDNPRWGCLRIRGELAKLGIRVSATRIRTPCGPAASARLLAVAAPPGASSCEPRPRGYWRSTSSLSRRSCSGRCTCCSRSRSGPVVCTSSASPGTPTGRGSPSKPATWQWGSGFKASGS